MLACLRMVLAHQGSAVSEAGLVAAVSLEESGIDPDQLAHLARTFGLDAEARQLDLEALAAFVEAGRFPIVLLDRTPLDREFAIHAVIPIRFSRHYVTLLDPLRGERRVTRRKFEQAWRRVGGWCVVWQSG